MLSRNKLVSEVEGNMFLKKFYGRRSKVCMWPGELQEQMYWDVVRG